MLVDMQDVITCATFFDDRLRGLGVAMGRISRFPIDLRHRPYNTRTTVRVCDVQSLHIDTGSLYLLLKPKFETLV